MLASAINENINDKKKERRKKVNRKEHVSIAIYIVEHYIPTFYTCMTSIFSIDEEKLMSIFSTSSVKV